jgi:hypothetical protein
MLLRGHPGQSVDAGIEKRPGGNSPGASRRTIGVRGAARGPAARAGADPGTGAPKDQPEAGHGEHFERSLEPLLMPQPDLSPEDPVDEESTKNAFRGSRSNRRIGRLNGLPRASTCDSEDTSVAVT